MGVESKHEESTRFQYLLCRGQESGGGADVRGFVSAFNSESAARTAFHELRSDDREGWAELAALDGRGRLTVIAWFGRPSPPLLADARRWSLAGRDAGRPSRQTAGRLQAALRRAAGVRSRPGSTG